MVPALVATTPCGLVPELVLSRYALQGGVVCLGVGGHKGVDFLFHAGDGGLELLFLGGRLGGGVSAVLGGGGEVLHRLLRQRDFRLGGGDRFLVLLDGFLIVLGALLRRPHLVIDVIQGVLQVVILLGQEVGGVGHGVVLLVVRLGFRRRLIP